MAIVCAENDQIGHNIRSQLSDLNAGFVDSNVGHEALERRTTCASLEGADSPGDVVLQAEARAAKRRRTRPRAVHRIGGTFARAYMENVQLGVAFVRRQLERLFERKLGWLGVVDCYDNHIIRPSRCSLVHAATHLQQLCPVRWVTSLGAYAAYMRARARSPCRDRSGLARALRLRARRAPRRRVLPRNAGSSVDGTLVERLARCVAGSGRGRFVSRTECTSST
jgi:hypothetical protein